MLTPPNTAASIVTLSSLKDVDGSLAVTIRAVWLSEGVDAAYAAAGDAATRAVEAYYASHYSAPKTREVKRALIDRLFGTHGVEYLGQHRRTGDSIYYCNAGDSYASTIIFHGHRLQVGCWGDLIERRAVREPVQY